MICFQCYYLNYPEPIVLLSGRYTDCAPFLSIIQIYFHSIFRRPEIIREMSAWQVIQLIAPASLLMAYEDK